MPTSQYLPFAIGGGPGSPNTLTPSALAALTTLLQNGFQPGIAKSEEINTILRQVTVAAAGLAKFSADFGALDANDDGSVENFKLAVKSAIDQIIGGRQFWTPGDVKATMVNAVPAGWLKANGQLVSRSTYAALFAAIGTTYGAGDGSTTFQLPDLRGEFLRGWDDGRGVDSGRALGSAQADQIKAHTHGIRTDDGDGFNPSSVNGQVRATDRGLVVTVNSDSFGGNETRPRNTSVLWLIRT